MTLAIVPNTRTTWYDPQLAAGEPVVIQNINYANGDNNSVMNSVIRYLQDVAKRWSATAIRSGLGLTGQGTGTINIASGYAIIDGRHIYNDSTVGVDISSEIDGDYYIVITLTQDAEGSNRDPENDSVTESAIAVGSFTAASNKLVLGKITVASSVASVVTSYSQVAEVRVGSLMPPQSPDGSSLSEIKIFTGETEKTEIAKFTGSTLRFYDGVKAVFGNDSDGSIYFNSGFGRLQIDLPTNGLYIDNSITMKSKSGSNAVIRIDTTDINNTSSNAVILFQEGGSSRWLMENDGDSANDFNIYNYNLASNVFKIKQADGALYNPLDNSGYYTGDNNQARFSFHNSDGTARITSNGDVVLDFDTNGTTTQYFRVTKNNLATELFRIDENGNIGFNTTDIENWNTSDADAIEAVRSSISFGARNGNKGITLWSNLYWDGTGLTNIKNKTADVGGYLFVSGHNFGFRYSSDSTIDTDAQVKDGLIFDGNGGSPTYDIFNATQTGIMTVNGNLGIGGTPTTGFHVKSGNNAQFDGNLVTISNTLRVTGNIDNNGSAVAFNDSIDVNGNDIILDFGGASIGWRFSTGDSTVKHEIYKENDGAGALVFDVNYSSGTGASQVKFLNNAGATLIEVLNGDGLSLSMDLDMNNNNIDDVASIDGGGDAVIFNDDINMNSNKLDSVGRFGTFITVPLYPNFRNGTGWGLVSTDEYVHSTANNSGDEGYIYLHLPKTASLIEVDVAISSAAGGLTELVFQVQEMQNGGTWTNVGSASSALTSSTSTVDTTVTVLCPTTVNEYAHYRLRMTVLDNNGDIHRVYSVAIEY